MGGVARVPASLAAVTLRIKAVLGVVTVTRVYLQGVPEKTLVSVKRLINRVEKQKKGRVGRRGRSEPLIVSPQIIF